MKKAVWPLVIIIILSFWALRPLFAPGFFAFHDDQQIARLFELDRALRAGQFPVRWVENLGFGLGYPLFNFYPPLVYYLGEVFHLIGFNFLDSIKLVWAVAILGSGLAMYFLAKEFFGRWGGIAAALFYVYAPYHTVDAYVRGALSELFAFVWLPLILLFSYKKKTVLTGLCLALLMLTHNLTFLPFLGFYAIWALVLDKKSLLVSIPVCFALTAFFWMPALYEKQFTLVDQILTKDLAAYSLHFVCPNQLWDSAWGFGASLPGCIDGMPFKLGKLHLIVSGLALAAGLLKRYKISVLLFLFFVLSVFMTTEYSRFIWDVIPPLWYIQFPWRFLIFSSLFSSLLAGSIFIFIKNRFLSGFVLVVLVGLLFWTNLKLFQPREYLPRVTSDQLTSDREIKWRVSSTSFEYLPKGIATKIQENGTTGVDITQSQISKLKYQIISGDFGVNQQNFKPDRFRLTGASLQGATLQFWITNFPGWKVWVDAALAPFTDDNKYKLITVTIPPGNHEIMGKFTDTPTRMAGNFISIAAVGLLLLFAIKPMYGKFNTKV